MKKIIAFALCAALMLSLVFSVSAAEVITSGVCGENLTWTLDSEGTLIISGTGKMTNWRDELYDPWFDERLAIKNVEISHGVTSIGLCALSHCENLTSLSIPASVNRIEYRALYDTELYNNLENWDNGVLYIDNHLIAADSSVSGSYKIKEGTLTIADGAFSNCDNLTSISIPHSVVTIGEGAFSYCNNLTSVSILSDSVYIGERAFSGAGIKRNAEYWKDGTLCIDGYLIEADKSLAGTYKINEGIHTIAIGAFAGCDGLTDVYIPSSVARVGDWAFCSRNLSSITVDANNANYCDIDGVLFSKDKKTLVEYPQGKGTNYKIPYGVTHIGDCAFAECGKLKVVEIPASVTHIGYGAFGECGITSIKLPPSITHIGEKAFCHTNITSIIIPSGVRYIGDFAFENTKISSAIIPSSVENIGYLALDRYELEIYYGGSENDWLSIRGISLSMSKEMKLSNEVIIHYNATMPELAGGFVTGVALRTDITAMINNHAIPSYNVNGYTYIVAEDLKDYGFSVYYDNATRTLAINRDNSKTEVTKYYEKPFVPQNEVGIVEHDILSTDIVTYLDNNYVESYNINGQTIIRFDELKRYADVTYDNDKRLIWVHIPRLN